MHRLLIIGYFIIYSANVGLIFIEGARIRRVMHGSPVLDIKQTDYLVTRFFVSIGSGHNCDTPLPDSVRSLIGKPKNYEFAFIKSWIFYPIGRICAPKPHHLWCTGSLLSPSVVQTACHCLVDFQDTADPSIKYPVKRNVYEVGYTVHPARRLVEEILTNEGVYCRNFVIHPKCGKDQDILLHDYALIVLHSPFERYQKHYAPIYPIANLAKIWLDTMNKAKVCLIIGFGRYKWVVGKPYVDDVGRPDVLRHGWTQALNYNECYVKLYGFRLENYTERATYLCTVSLPYRPNQEALKAGKGDSGGPVTCDNQYVGIVSQGGYGTREDGPYDIEPAVGYDRHASTAFSAYENSVEYRAELSYRINELYGSEDPFKDFSIFPSRIAVYSGRTLSSGALQTHTISILIIFSLSSYCLGISTKE